jgi:hypothetical protein
MLRGYALQYGRSWDKSLPYAEFSYNNSYQESLKMTPFEMLYGHRYRIPLFWNETGEHKVFGPNILQEAKRQVRIVREKRYVVHTLRKLSFVVWDYMYLKMSHMRGLWHFKIQGKLAPRHIGLFKVTEEREEELKVEFLNLFSDPSKSRGRDSF